MHKIKNSIKNEKITILIFSPFTANMFTIDFLKLSEVLDHTKAAEYIKNFENEAQQTLDSGDSLTKSKITKEIR